MKEEAIKNKAEKLILKINIQLIRTALYNYSDFSIGLTDNVEESLHDRNSHEWWISNTADNNEIAEIIEQHFINLGMRLAMNSKKKDTANIILISKVTPTTIEA